MRWIFRLFLFVVILALVAGAFLVWFPANTVARLAAERFSAQTGRQLTIGGDVSATLWPVIGVTANKVRLGNAQWGQGDNLIAADRVYIGIDPLTLFSDVISITSVELVEPVISLERAPDGQSNWTFSTGTGNTGDGRTVALSSLSVTNGKITYLNGDAPPVEVLDADGTLTLANGGADLSFNASYRDQPVGGTIAVTTLAALLSGQTDTKANVTVGTSSLNFTGKFGLADLSAAGNLRLEVTDRTAVFGILGLEPPDLPQGFGRDRIGLIGTLDLADSRASVGDLQMNLDQNHFTGRAVVDFSGRPRVDATLAAARIDVASDQGSSGAGWSTDPLSLAALGSFDGVLALTFSEAQFGGLNFGASRLHLILQQGAIEAEIAELGLFDGTVSGTLSATAGKSLAFQTDLVGENLATDRAGLDLIGSDRLVSRANGKLALSGNGTSMAALMQSLDGTGDLVLSQGELKGVDVAAALRNLDPNFTAGSARTLFDEATASFSITNGVLDNEDLVLSAPILLGSGQGRVGLGPRDLDYTFVAKLPESVLGKHVELPIRIYGTWSKPQFSFDFNSLIAARFGVDLEGLAQDQIDDLRGRIFDELGIEIAPGQDLKEALTNGLQQKATDAMAEGLLGTGFRDTPVAQPAVRAETSPDVKTEGEPVPPAPDLTEDTPDVPAPIEVPDNENTAPELDGAAPTNTAPETGPAPAPHAEPESQPEAVVVEPVVDGTGPTSSPFPRPRPAGFVLAPVEPDPVVDTVPEVPPEPVPEVVPESAPDPADEPAPEPEPEPQATDEPAVAPEAEPAPAEPEVEPTVEPAPEPAPAEEFAACPETITGETQLPCRQPDGTLVID